MYIQTTDGTTGRNIILTTPGSSGSTFFCKALSQLPNVVALNEPIPLKIYKNETTQKVCELLKKRFKLARDQLMREGKTENKVKGNTIELDDFGIQTEPFDLVIKQPLTFTALIGNKALECFEWYALVRNPLITLCSWVKNSKKLQAGREGRATTAEMHSPKLKNILDNLTNNGASKDQLRLALLNWAFEKYKTLPERCVIRYEDFVASPLHALEQIVPAAKKSSIIKIQTIDGNANPAYMKNAQIFANLVFNIPDNSPILKFYTRNEVQSALNKLT